MGHRNPYTISVDPYRTWLTWGDIGPDEGLQSEEHNLVTAPGFMGWPYFAGNNIKFRGTVGIAAADMNPAKPLNKSKNNTGLEELPPAQPAIRPYRQSAAVTGPIYYYDGAKPAAGRLPPHFNKKWIYTDFNAGWINVAGVSEDGKSLSGEVAFWKSGTLSKPLDLELGPDGSLYAVEYSGWFSAGQDTRISKFEFKGNCYPATPVPPIVTALEDARRINRIGTKGLVAPTLQGESLVLPSGIRGATLVDLAGRQVFQYRRETSHQEVRITLPAKIQGTLLKASFEK